MAVLLQEQMVETVPTDRRGPTQQKAWAKVVKVAMELLQPLLDWTEYRLVPVAKEETVVAAVAAVLLALVFPLVLQFLAALAELVVWAARAAMVLPAAF